MNPIVRASTNLAPAREKRQPPSRGAAAGAVMVLCATAHSAAVGQTQNPADMAAATEQVRLPAPATQQLSRIEPTLRTRLTTSDVKQTSTGEGQRSTLLEVAPELTLRLTTASVRVEGDVTARAMYYVDGDRPNRLLPSGRVGLQSELMDRWLFLNASVTADQTAIDPYQLQGLQLSTSDLTTDYRLRLEPYVQHQLSPSAAIYARSAHLWTRHTGVATLASLQSDSHEQDNVLRWEHKPTPLGGSVEVSSQRTTYPDNAQAALDVSAMRSAVNYAFDRQFVFGLSVGVERSRFSLVNETNTIYGIKTDWQPSERSRASASIEHRFFGWGGQAELRHRSPFVAIALRLERTPVTQPSTVTLGSADGDVSSLLDAMFTTRYPDPAQRAEIVRNMIATLGLPKVLNGPLDLFPTYAQLRRGGSLNATLMGRTTSLTLGAFTWISTQLLREGDAYTPLPAISADNRQIGANMGLTVRLAPFTNVGVTFQRMHMNGIGSQAANASDEKQVDLFANHSISAKSSVAAGIRARRYHSTVNASTREAAAYVGMTTRF
jgi:uncharacterized protein (PEP-CTERM system associated)